MATKNIKLTKSVISNSYSNNIHSKEFNKLAKSDESIDEQKIIDTYNTVFYSIPKTGKNSHTSIIKRTYDWLNWQTNAELDVQIENLLEISSQKNAELTEVQDPEIKEHPLYNNGTFLIAGENGEKYPGMHTIYVMQEGLKRPFDNDGIIYEAVRKSLNLAHKDNPNTVGNEKFSNKYYLTVDELNAIPDGKRITVAADLALRGDELLAENVDLNIEYSSYELQIKCIGREASENAELLLEATDFYIQNTGGCLVEYVYVQPTWGANNKIDDYTPFVRTSNINKGDTLTINIGKNTNRQADDAISDDVVYPEVPSVLYNGTSIPGYIKKWGEGNKYEGIIRAEGRMEYIEIRNDKIIHDPRDDFKVLNGIPAGLSLSTFAPGNELSSYGTRLIYPGGSGLYGDQGHEDNLYDKVFSDPDSEYYKPQLYGQPIIRMNSDYLVLIDFEDTNIGNYAGFVSLEKKTKIVPTGLSIAKFAADGIFADVFNENHVCYFKRNGNTMKKEFFEINKDGTNLNWHLLRTHESNRIKHLGMNGKNGLPVVGTIGYGYNIAPPNKGTTNPYTNVSSV